MVAVKDGEKLNFANAGITGIFITYLLSLTGKDKAIVKGAGVGTMLWILVSGLIAKLGLNIQTKKPIVPFIDFIDHIVFGALTSLFYELILFSLNDLDIL